MVSKQHRFQGRGSLNFVYKRGTSARVEYLVLRHSSARQPDYRLAVVVSRKVSKAAVVRNRIRRRLYEAVRKMRITEASPWPHDMILSVFDERLATMPAEQLQNLVASLLKKAKIT